MSIQEWGEKRGRESWLKTPDALSCPTPRPAPRRGRNHARIRVRSFPPYKNPHSRAHPFHRRCLNGQGALLPALLSEPDHVPADRRPTLERGHRRLPPHGEKGSGVFVKESRLLFRSLFRSSFLTTSREWHVEHRGRIREGRW